MFGAGRSEHLFDFDVTANANVLDPLGILDPGPLSWIWLGRPTTECLESQGRARGLRSRAQVLAPNLEIVDSIRIPAGLVPGDYVLQWRWDVRAAG